MPEFVEVPQFAVFYPKGDTSRPHPAIITLTNDEGLFDMILLPVRGGTFKSAERGVRHISDPQLAANPRERESRGCFEFPAEAANRRAERRQEIREKAARTQTAIMPPVTPKPAATTATVGSTSSVTVPSQDALEQTLPAVTQPPAPKFTPATSAESTDEKVRSAILEYHKQGLTLPRIAEKVHRPLPYVNSVLESSQELVSA